MSGIYPIVHVEENKLCVLKQDGTTWPYKLRKEEVSQEILALLIERQKEKWDELAFGNFVDVEGKKGVLQLKGMKL